MGLPGCMFVCLLILLLVFLFNSGILSDHSSKKSTDMVDNGGKNNFIAVLAVTSTPLSTLGHNLLPPYLK